MSKKHTYVYINIWYKWKFITYTLYMLYNTWIYDNIVFLQYPMQRRKLIDNFSSSISRLSNLDDIPQPFDQTLQMLQTLTILNIVVQKLFSFISYWRRGGSAIRPIMFQNPSENLTQPIGYHMDSLFPKCIIVCVEQSLKLSTSDIFLPDTMQGQCLVKCVFFSRQPTLGWSCLNQKYAIRANPPPKLPEW